MEGTARCGKERGICGCRSAAAYHKASRTAGSRRRNSGVGTDAARSSLCCCISSRICTATACGFRDMLGELSGLSFSQGDACKPFTQGNNAAVAMMCKVRCQNLMCAELPSSDTPGSQELPSSGTQIVSLKMASSMDVMYQTMAALNASDYGHIVHYRLIGCALQSSETKQLYSGQTAAGMISCLSPDTQRLPWAIINSS